MLYSIDERIGLEFNRNLAFPAKVGKTLEQCGECYARFQASQRRAQAEMDAVTKTEMAIGMASYIERASIRELRPIHAGDRAGMFSHDPR